MSFAKQHRFAAGSLVLSLTLCASLYGQGQPGSRPVQGPVIGFIYDKAAGIRPVLGLPGAATLGPAILSREGVESAVLAPGRDFALAILSGQRQVALLRNLNFAPEAALLDVPSGPARMVYSPSGDAVVLYYADPARLWAVKGLPDSPAVAWTQDLPLSAGALGALAVSDEARGALAAASGEPAPIWALSPEGGAQLLITASASPAFAFLHGKNEAVIAGGAMGEVWLLNDWEAEPRLRRIGGLGESVSRPVAVAISQDNARAFIAASQPRAVITLTISDGETAEYPCPAEPVALDRLGAGSAFLLNEPGNGPIWLMDAGGGAPRIFFVPDQARLQRTSGRTSVPRRVGGDR